MKPNLALKFARMDAGLTQEELADLLHVSAITIYRWERGENSPNSYFRERLCKIFRLSKQELGLQEEESEIWPREHASFLIDPCFPGNQIDPLGQQSLIKEIVSSHRTIGVLGLPGSGKSSIVQAIASLPDIRQQVEGILWGSVGQESKPLRHLQRWLLLLGGEGMVPEQIEDVQDRLRVLLRGRKMLIVLDDLWNAEDILPYQLGPQCHYVLTTRLPVVANTVCSQILHPRMLTDPQAFHLLSNDLPPVLVKEHREILRALCQQVGLLPLALEQMGKYLRREARTSSNRRFQEALTALFQPTLYLHLHLPPDCSLAISIKRSEGRLSPAARQAFFILASLLPNAPATFAERQVVDLIQKSRPFQLHDFDQLVDIGLVSVAGKNCYQIHPVVAAYARQLAEKQPDTAA